MKKFISIIAAVAMTSTAFASIALAEGNLVMDLTCEKTTVDPGEQFVVKYNIKGEDDDKFANSAADVKFDTSKFTLINTKKVGDWDGLVVNPTAKNNPDVIATCNETGILGLTFASANNQWFDEGQVYEIDITFAAKAEAAGEGQFTVEAGVCCDEMDNVLNVDDSKVLGITVNGTTPTPTPSPEPTPEVVQAANGTKDYGDGFKTVGLNGYVIPNSGLNTIKFTFTTGDSYNFDLKNTFTGDSQVTYGLNIIDVPSNETIEVDTAVGTILLK